MSSEDATKSSATESNLFAELAPQPQRLRELADGLLRRARTSLADIESELASTPEGPRIREVIELVPERDSLESAEAGEQLDALWARVQGRTAYEQLLTLFIALGMAEDALGQYAQLREADISDALGWQPWHDEIVAVLQELFERDIHIDDRLAMWGRRIAGDTMLWARELAGIELGASADDVLDGAEAGAQKFGKELFANHSRRMNQLKLAA